MRPAGSVVQWCVYIIEASDRSYYTGITTDIARRFRQHREGPRGARYFRGRPPLRVVFLEAGHTRSSAAKREASIKKLQRAAKTALVLAHDVSWPGDGAIAVTVCAGGGRAGTAASNGTRW